MLNRNKAQSTLEYALIIAAVVGALLTINNYMNKGMQGRLKESTDQIGKQFSADDKYTSAWKAASDGTTTTTEKRPANTGITTSVVSVSEKITKAETEEWGSTPDQKYP